MTVEPDEILSMVLESLSEEERESSVIYLDEAALPEGAVVEIDGQEFETPWPAVIAFADLQPMLNWAHACRYFLIRTDGEGVKAIDARFPPFLHGAAESLRVLWKAEGVPDWTVAC